MFTYAYRCTQLDWKYEKEKKALKRQRFAMTLCTFEALYLTKVLKRKKKCVPCFQILLNCRPLLTGSNLYLGCDIHRSVHFKMWDNVTVYRTQLLSHAAL